MLTLQKKSEQIPESISSNLILHRFNNPPMRNLCFSNVVVTCLLNVPILRTYLQENEESNCKESRSIFGELINLSRKEGDKLMSTQRLRTIVTSKCLESGQTSHTFNNNMQFDCVEFLQSLLEHFWKESSVPDTWNESIFGGLFQESFQCTECENVEKHNIKRLPDVISISIEGETVQKSIDSHFSRELVEKNCSKCHSQKSWKSQEIIVYPTTLIIQLKRFTFNEVTRVSKKLHNPVSSPATLSLNNESIYQLNAVVNHIGENLTSGHYNILLADNQHSKLILVDDLEISYILDSNQFNAISYVVLYTKL